MNDPIADPIPRITRDAPEAGSGNVVAENVAALKALFPSIVTDGQVDFDVLRQLLGDAIEDGEELYGLNWKGKRRARAFALTPTLATLRPAKDESEDWASTRNILIEGDNLEVLKCLRRSYAGQVKLIYIDPPYNTGNDFVYPDNYADSLGNYERLTGQRGADGAAMTTNKEASGRFHTDWLNMMYPRLLLAKELLRDDGVLLLSCDAAEVANVRLVLDEAFGGDNYIEQMIWKKSYGGGSKEKFVVTQHEYIFIYARSINAIGVLEVDQDEDKVEQYYVHTDEFVELRGPHRLKPLEATKSMGRRENLVFPIRAPDGSEVLPKRQWWWSQDRVNEVQLSGGLHFAHRNGEWTVSYKQYLRDEEGVQRKAKPFSILDGPFTQASSQEIRALFNDTLPFQFPKPIDLISQLGQIVGFKNDDVILDFFAGSGTTGHAVMAQNAADGDNRRYILVQLPEPLDPANASQKTAADFCDTLGVPRNIAELTKERLRRAGAKVAAENPDKAIDTGFRVYKLATSNLKPWQPDPDNLERSLLDAVDNILPDRTEDDLLVELLLKTGIDLTLPMETRTICQRPVHALGGGVLIVCLGDVSDADAEDLGQGIADWHAELDPIRATTFYFRDSGFATAAAKANVAAIVRQRVGNRVEKLASI